MSIPILVMSDCPSQTSGLARVTRDLCTLIAAMPEFRVATLGFTGTGSSRLPFHCYHMLPGEFGEVSLPMVWDDWSQGEPGIVLTIWDLSRMMWLARPEFCEDQATREWLQHARKHKLRLWSYLPIDSAGPRGKLTEHAREVLLGLDRVVTYSPWALDVVRNTIGIEAAEGKGATWLPHGLNLKTFTPALIKHEATCSASTTPVISPGVCTCHSGLNVGKIKRIGIVGTNQVRKSWDLAAASCAGLAEALKGDVRFWWHCDVRQRHWNLQALIADFNLGEYVEITQPPVTDQWLAEQYRKCDVTLHPGPEGFGFPIFESLACGTPAIHGDYAGGASIMRSCGLEELLVPPVAWRLEGQHNQLRPVYEPADWVEKVMAVLSVPRDGPANCYANVQHLGWDRLGHVWYRWLKEGIGAK